MIKKIDMELLDSQRDNFDIIDNINYNFEGLVNMEYFIDFLKKENCYELIEDKIKEYMQFYSIYDNQDINNSAIEIQENVKNEFIDMINNSLID